MPTRFNPFLVTVRPPTAAVPGQSADVFRPSAAQRRAEQRADQLAAAAERRAQQQAAAAEKRARQQAAAAARKAAADAKRTAAAAAAAAKLETKNMAAAAKPTVVTVNTKIDKVLDALGSLGLDVGDIGRVISPSATQPVVVQTPAPKDNTPWLLIGGAALLLLMYFKR